MNKKNEYPIFYDRKQKRSRYSKKAFLLFLIAVVSLTSLSFASILVKPQLPVLSIEVPEIKKPDFDKKPFSDPKAKNLASLDISTAIGSNEAPISEAPLKFDPRVMAFYVDWDENSFMSLKKNLKDIDVLIPEWLNLQDATGQVKPFNMDGHEKVISHVRQNKRDLKIVPLVNNYDPDSQEWDGEGLSAILRSPESRNAAVSNLLDYVKKNNFAGISIDFENIAPDQQVYLELFMKDLSGVFQAEKLEVYQNIPLSDTSYNIKNLSQYSDRLILMAYDENSANDTGPIGSQNWYELSLKSRLAEVNAEKIVVALGNYGYDGTAGKDVREPLTFQQAVERAKKYSASINTDPGSLNSKFEYSDDGVHTVWMLDGVSAFNQVKSAYKFGNFHGIALWRLGSEDPSIWKIFQGSQNLDEEKAQTLENFGYGYDLSYVGEGELLKVVSSPRDGARQIEYEKSSGLIKRSAMTEYPSAYTIQRWGGGNAKKIVLTFDDGPDRAYTPQILDILKKYDVKASFFVIGANASVNPDIIRRMVKEGHTIGSHTYTHPNISKISQSQFDVELDSTQRSLQALTGRKSLLFRPPYAEDVEPATPDQIAPLENIDEAGYYTAGMHIDSNDWKKPGADKIFQEVINGAETGKGNVVLLHDGGGDREQTVAALPLIIEKLRSEGYEIVGLEELVGLERDSLMPKITSWEHFFAKINFLTIHSFSGFINFMRIMFIVGIILGIARFAFIGTLSAVQRFYSRKEMQKNEYLAAFKPSVSVIIPTYNEEKVIAKTINSILRSDYENFNIIVVDDGSSDKTVDVVSQAFAGQKNITIYSKTENGGKAEALNFGINNANSEIVILLDADTVFNRNTISKIIRRFSDKRVMAVAGNAKVGNRVNILTRWQALEYITSQNLDKRAFELLNGIVVVPGAIGAWRKSAVIEAGGFSSDTLAEDTDLTLSLVRSGQMVAYDEEAHAYTEAPESLQGFIKQRFRWMFGTLQSVWKHKDTLFRKKYGAIGFISLPNVLVFQIFFPLISPLMDLMIILSLVWAGWQNYHHPDYATLGFVSNLIYFYVLFLVIDLVTAIIPYLFEPQEDWSLLVWLPFQRFFYRQLMYYVAIKTIASAIRGKLVGWGKLERKATVGALGKA